MKSFAETPISVQNTVYLKEEIRRVLDVGANDVLEWFIDNGTILVKKKGEVNAIK